MKRVYLFCVLSSFLLAVTLQEAQLEHRNKNYVVAASYFEKLASKNNPIALYELASMYKYGEGVKKDNKKSRALYKKSAIYFQKKLENGENAEAEFYLAIMYEYGFGVNINCTKAIRYYILSADKNYIDAQNNLGVIYKEGGCGVKEDREKAYKYLNLASQTGDYIAKMNLDILCKETPEVCKNKSIK